MLAFGRYRCIDSIVRSAFPEDATSTVPDLLRLGRRMGYAMPDLSEKSPGVEAELVKRAATRAPDRDPAGPEPSSRPAPEPTRAAENENRPGSENLPQATEEPLGLIKDTAGRAHFIGPSGSLQFLGQLRGLLLASQNGAARRSSTPSRLTATFTDEDAAQALEIDDGQDGGGRAESVTAAAEGQPVGHSPASIRSDFTRDFANISAAGFNDVMRQLPPLPVMDSLLKLYFKTCHPDFPLFHRGTFEEEYEIYISGAARSFQHPQQQARAGMQTARPPEPGWLGCLHMMMAFAALSDTKELSGDVDSDSLCRRCVNLTISMMPQLISRCTLSNVRALLLLSLFLHNHNERNAAWNLVGTAMRLSFALGLHRATENGSFFRPMEREARKRVFCTLYGFEQFLASSLGRPSGCYDFEAVEVVPPREGLLDGGQDDDEFIKISLSLQNILARARVSLAVRTLAVTQDDRRSDVLTRQEESSRSTLDVLAAWRRELASQHPLWNLPSIWETDDSLFPSADAEEEESSREPFQVLQMRLAWHGRSRLRSALVVHLQFRYIAIIVTRSALLRHVARAQGDRHEPGNAGDNIRGTPVASRSLSEESRLSERCVTHAVQLCRLILLLDSFDMINGISAMDVFYAYCGAMVLILASLRSSLQVSQQREGGRGARLHSDLRALIEQTRDVLMRVRKCGTMNRFAHVVAAFEDGSRQDDHILREDSTGKGIQMDAGATRGAARRALNGSGHPGLARGRHPVTAGAPLEADLAMGYALPQQDPFGAQSAYAAGLMPRLGLGAASSMQASLLTSLDGGSDANGWMIDPIMGMDVCDFVDWGDIDSLLARNPGPI